MPAASTKQAWKRLKSASYLKHPLRLFAAIWIPGLTGLAENEAAHASASDLHYRAPHQQDSTWAPTLPD